MRSSQNSMKRWRSSPTRNRHFEKSRAFPKKAHPMDTLRAGVLALGALDPDLNDTSHAANVRKAIRLIARTASIVAAGYRVAKGQESVAPRTDLNHSQNFLYVLTGKA